MCLLGDNIYKFLIRPYAMNGAHSRLSHIHSVNRSFILDWFEWDCLTLENVNVVTQQTQSSHIYVYI